MKLRKNILSELLKIGFTYIILVIILKIVFYKEPFKTILIVSLIFFYLFLIPGYFAMLYWKSRVELKERLVMGCGVSAAILGVSCYILGLFGLNIFIWSFVYPLLVVLFALIVNFKKIVEN